MENADAPHRRVEKPEEMRQCLEALMLHSGASLVLNKPGSLPLPVLLECVAPGEGLLVDISSVREVAAELMRSEEFRLLGQSGGKLLRSGPLRARLCREIDGVLLCDCGFPEFFEVFQRRHDYRARLGPGMDCDVRAVSPRGECAGLLRDISMSGCLLEFPLGAALTLAHSEAPLDLDFLFPNGLRFAIKGVLRHHYSDIDRQFIQAGFRFEDPDPGQDRSLWYFVREIERETARQRGKESSLLEPSLLFQVTVPQARRPRRGEEEVPTPAVRGLTHAAKFLGAQILALRTGGAIDGAQLSRQAERLLGLLDQDREALLFALSCLRHQPPLVRHCLGVAVRLVDMAGDGVPADVRKVIMAGAMVHDFGKVLLPHHLLQAQSLDGEQERQVRRHVELLLPRLAECRWLTREILAPVVEQANERLDGSGYPHGLRGAELRELARMTAVVDVADAMARARPDRPPRPVDAIQRHLLGQPAQFDPRWVRHYIRHFGKLPIGTLLRFRSGELAWVKALDKAGAPALLQRALECALPPGAREEDEIAGEALERLGSPIEIIPGELSASPADFL